MGVFVEVIVPRRYGLARKRCWGEVDVEFCFVLQMVGIVLQYRDDRDQRRYLRRTITSTSQVLDVNRQIAGATPPRGDREDREGKQVDEDTKNRRGKTREGGDVEISPRQQATLDAIREYWARHRIGPSRADLAAALGLKSQSGTDRHIQTLLRRGLVESVPGASRSLRAVESGDVPLIEAKGRVSHRKALAEDVHRIGWIPDCLAARFSPRPDYFLVITDEKLCRLGVATGDPVAVRDARRATTRDVVVARVNGAVCWDSTRGSIGTRSNSCRPAGIEGLKPFGSICWTTSSR